MNYTQAVPGQVYRHYKGGMYLVIAVATTTHNHIVGCVHGERDVVYVSLTHGTIVTRPLWRDARDQDSWTDIIEWPDGKKRNRFSSESEFS
jgi:hypothetical protein